MPLITIKAPFGVLNAEANAALANAALAKATLAKNLVAAAAASGY